MKIYTFPPAPNPTRLRVYLGEKGIEIPTEVVNITKGEQSEPAFRARNPMGGVPVLELDDGTCLTESLAIMEYLEELHPDPPMIGSDPVERARVRALERIAEISVMSRIVRIFHSTRSVLPGVVPRKEFAEDARAGLPGPLGVLDEAIGDNPFVAGDRPTIADCTLFAALRFGEFGEIEIDPAFGNVRRWYNAFRQRPSAQ